MSSYLGLDGRHHPVGETPYSFTDLAVGDVFMIGRDDGKYSPGFMFMKVSATQYVFVDQNDPGHTPFNFPSRSYLNRLRICRIPT